MARVPCKICVTRFVGTFILRASSAALIPSSFSSSARCSPGWIAAIAMAILLVIVNDLHMRRPRRSAGPLEAHAPLIVDAYAVLALAVAMQRFKTVSGQRGKVRERRSCLQAVQLQPRGTLDCREGLDALPARELPGPLVPIADDHSPKMAEITRYVKRIAGWLDLNFCFPDWDEWRGDEGGEIPPLRGPRRQKAERRRKSGRSAPSCGGQAG